METLHSRMECQRPDETTVVVRIYVDADLRVSRAEIEGSGAAVALETRGTYRDLTTGEDLTVLRELKPPA